MSQQHAYSTVITINNTNGNDIAHNITIPLTIDDLIDLAKLGRKKIDEDRRNGVTSWLGFCPGDDTLDDDVRRALREKFRDGIICEDVS